MECLYVSGDNYCLWNTTEYNTHCDTQRLLCLWKIPWSMKLQAHTVWPPEKLHLSTMSTLWKHIATAWILQCHQKNLSLFPLCFSPTLCLSLSALCVKSENEEQQGMNGLGEMHSYSGMSGMHSSTKNVSYLLVPQSMPKKCRSWRDPTITRKYASSMKLTLVSKKWWSHAGVTRRVPSI